MDNNYLKALDCPNAFFSITRSTLYVQIYSVLLNGYKKNF